MKAYVRGKDYFLVLDRRIGEIEIIGDGLEADIMDYDTQQPTGIAISLIIGNVNNNLVELVSYERSIKVVAGHQVLSSLLHGGIFTARYDSTHTLNVTDGIMPPNIGWPDPKSLDR